MKTITLAVALALTGCAAGVQVTGAAKTVRVTSNPDVIKPCKFLGNVSAKAEGGTWATTPGERAQLRLQQQTHDLGGNVVLISSATGDSRVANATGEAYACP